MAAAAARSRRSFILPERNGLEAALIGEATVYPAGCLLDVCAHLTGRAALTRCDAQPEVNGRLHPDMQDVKGQGHAKRVLEIAAAGGHSVIMVGPPGTGKSMLAERMPGILPPMTREEAIAAASMQSLGHGAFDVANWGQRPFRAPHHTASAIALVGGGTWPRPGEISMALHGVLFLDELPEFGRKVLEVLREPLESGRINVSRAARQAEFPAQFQLIAAMNPCPCGYLGHPNGRCRCTPDQVIRYRRKISGPLLDRIDLQVEVPDVPQEDLSGAATGEPSEAIRARVAAARERRMKRQDHPNATLPTREVDRHCAPDAEGAMLLKQAISRLGLSARGYHRVLKVARTIADLAGEPAIAAAHVAEAIQYRRFERAS
jgi:magnesium chelatase family protein